MAPVTPAASPVPAALAKLVLDGLSSPRYHSYLEERSLSGASINLHLAARRKLATEVSANFLIDTSATAAIAGVPGTRRSSARTGN